METQKECVKQTPLDPLVVRVMIMGKFEKSRIRSRLYQYKKRDRKTKNCNFWLRMLYFKYSTSFQCCKLMVQFNCERHIVSGSIEYHIITIYLCVYVCLC